MTEGGHKERNRGREKGEKENEKWIASGVIYIVRAECNKHEIRRPNCNYGVKVRALLQNCNYCYVIA